MIEIKLTNLSVDFPIYQASARSIKKEFLTIATGGKIVSGKNETMVVRALSNLNIDIVEGERVNLIGHNGSGKSTLLRTLAGVYKPTAGRITTTGRIGTLLDSFIGIDLDATGVENITARGLCLGLTIADINSKIAEVAEFSQLGAFLELPMRTYSAGMQTRLAFSISTLIRPDILLLDEGISAGDASFIQRASARLNSFISKAGILVLASHDVSLARRLCNRAIVLTHGSVVFDGSLEEGIKYYNGVVATPPKAEFVF